MSDGGDLIGFLIDLGFDRFLNFGALLVVQFVLMHFEIRVNLIAKNVNLLLHIFNLCF
jgi:hypothetical protein